MTESLFQALLADLPQEVLEIPCKLILTGTAKDIATRLLRSILVLGNTYTSIFIMVAIIMKLHNLNDIMIINKLTGRQVIANKVNSEANC